MSTTVTNAAATATETVNDTGFSIRRNALLHGVVGAGSGILGAAFLARGSTGWDVALGILMIGIAVGHLVAFAAARTPLFMADDTAVRVRIAHRWRRLRWGAIQQIVVEEPGSLLGEGRLVVIPRDPAALTDLSLLERIHVVWTQRWFGAPLSVPLAITTTSSHTDAVDELATLARGRCEVVALHGHQLAQLEPVDRSVAPSLPVSSAATIPRAVAAEEHPAQAPEPVEEPAPEVQAFEPVSPLREVVEPRRVEVTLLSEAPRSGALSSGALSSGALPPEALPSEVEDAPAQENDWLSQPPEHPTIGDPVIGPEILAARSRLGLGVDELSERTRIRPHVIEGIERDDFAPCGGDFYARGHLAALAKALGLEVEPLMREYDARYAHGPINARRVFEAELATGLSGGMRATAGGPKWSLIVGAVLSLAMVWGVARFFADPTQVVAAPGSQTDAAGLSANHQPIMSPLMVPKRMTVTAAHAAARVVVRDRTGRVLWSGHLGMGQRRQIAGVAPFTVQSDNAGAVEVKVSGKQLGTVGRAGESGHRKFG